MVSADLRRTQRPVWAALSVLLLTGMITSLFLASHAKRSAEAQASAQAQVSVQQDLAPLLTPSDVTRSVTGQRYQTLSALVTKRLLSAGPSDGVYIVSPDGLVTFSFERDRIGDHVGRDQIDRVMRQGRETAIEGGSFVVLVPLRLSVEGPVEGVVELTQPYEALWSSASKPWRLAAVGFAFLLVPSVALLAISFRGHAGFRRPAAARPTAAPADDWGASSDADRHAAAGNAGAAAPAGASASPAPDAPAQGPSYLNPNFRREIEARREAEERAGRAEEIAAQAQQQLASLKAHIAEGAAAAPVAGGGTERLKEQLDAAFERIQQGEHQRAQLAEQLRRAEAARVELSEKLATESKDQKRGAAAPDPKMQRLRGELEAQVQTAQQQAAEARDHVRAADERAQAADERARGADERAATAEERASAAQERIQAAEAQVAIAQERAESMEREAARGTAHAEEVERTAGEVAEELTALREQVAAAQGRATAAEARATAAEQRAGKLEADAQVAWDRAKANEGETSVAAERAASAASEAARAAQLVADAEGEAVHLREQLAAAQAEIGQMRRRTDEAAARADSAEEHLQRAAEERRKEIEAAALAAEEQPQLEEVLRLTRERLQKSGERLQEIEDRARAAEHDLVETRERVEELEGEQRREKLSEAMRHLKHGEAEGGPASEPIEDRRSSAPFMKALSLDAKNSIAAIHGLILTMKHGEELDQAPMMRKLAAHARKLDHLVADLLDADRLARGDIQLTFRRTDVDALVRRVVDEAAVDDEYTVKVQSSKVIVAVDPIRLEEIVVNLLNNAANRSRPRHDILVRVESQDEGVLISVEDDEPSSDGSMSPVVARFADVHGGWAIVEGRQGGGSAFRVYLPDHDSVTVAPEQDTIELGTQPVSQAAPNAS